jgi:ElaB/YqjD/DUF883 family membrane-anchored ribosome-binding protein
MDDLHDERLEGAADAQPGSALTEQLEERYHELEERLSDVRERLDAANDRAVHFIQENPGLAILGAVGVGYLLGRMASRRLLI